MTNSKMDGGGFPLFRSYHDVRLPPRLVGPTISDHLQFRFAFDDFVKALRNDIAWRKWFTRSQIAAIEEARVSLVSRL